MRAVEIRVRHGARETVIDAAGVRAHAADALVTSEGSQRFELEVTFQCSAHESLLRIAAEEDGSMRALVEVQPVERSRIPIGQAPTKRALGGRTSPIRLVRSETER